MKAQMKMKMSDEQEMEEGTPVLLGVCLTGNVQTNVS